MQAWILSEVLCTCRGWIQHSLSQRNHTDPFCRGGDVKFLSGASRICCCCHSNELWAFHFVSMRIFIWGIIQNKHMIPPKPNYQWILRRGHRMNTNYLQSHPNTFFCHKSPIIPQRTDVISVCESLCAPLVVFCICLTIFFTHSGPSGSLCAHLVSIFSQFNLLFFHFIVSLLWFVSTT